jgi:hypothetical protein
VQGSVNPDEYYVFKPTLKQGHAPILQKVCGTKEFRLIYDTGGGKDGEERPVSPDDRDALRNQPMRDSCLGPLGVHRSRSTTPRSVASLRRWISNGRKTEILGDLHRSGPSGDGAIATQTDTYETFRLREAGRVLTQVAASAQRSPPARARDQERRTDRPISGRGSPRHRQD